MTPQEAKFILRAHRADGRYADDDPLFAEALRVATQSPELETWLQRERSFDATLANRMDALQPPAGLRETILAGARASRVRRNSWRQARWLGLAAALAIAGGIGLMIRSASEPAFTPRDLAQLARADYDSRPHLHDYTGAMAEIARELSTHPVRFTQGLALAPERLAAANCQTIEVGGRAIYEVCFERDGTWFHLYVTRSDAARNDRGSATPIFLHEQGITTAAWMQGDLLFSLVTRGGEDALRRIV